VRVLTLFLSVTWPGHILQEQDRVAPPPPSGHRASLIDYDGRIFRTSAFFKAVPYFLCLSFIHLLVGFIRLFQQIKRF